MAKNHNKQNKEKREKILAICIIGKGLTISIKYTPKG